MNAFGFPESLMRLLYSCVSTFPAAELLVFLHDHPSRSWTPEEIVAAIQPTIIPLPALREYLALFHSKELIAEDPSGHFRYCPATPDLQSAIEDLHHAFNERPVTLIRAIYKVTENKIQSFADSFNLRKEEDRGNH